MSNFAKGFRRARTGRLSGCDRVPERPVPRPEKRIASPPPGTKRNRFPARVAANGRCKPALRPRPGAVSHPGNRAIAVSGRQPLPAPRTGNDESLFPFPRCKGRRNPDAPNGENETGYSTKTRQFFLWKSKPASTISTSTSPTLSEASPFIAKLSAWSRAVKSTGQTERLKSFI